MANRKYSVFIAYHGTYAETGSRKYAEQIFECLEKEGISCFCFTKNNSNRNYKANVKEVLESDLFLLICTNDIKREKNGSIKIREHLDLFMEIDTFWGLTQIGDVAINDSMVVGIGNQFKKGSEALLHTMFKDRVGLLFDNFNDDTLCEISKWVKERMKEKEKLYAGQSFEIKKLYTKRNKIQNNKLQELIGSAKIIRAIGISNSTLCEMNMSDALSDFLKKGGELEILFLDPKSKNTLKRTAEEKQRKGRIADETKRSFNGMLDVIHNCNCPVKAKLYLYDLVPRINALFIDDTLILQYYSYNNMGKDNPTMLIEKDMRISPLFEYTLSTFEYVLNTAQERDQYIL